MVKSRKNRIISVKNSNQLFCANSEAVTALRIFMFINSYPYGQGHRGAEQEKEDIGKRHAALGTSFHYRVAYLSLCPVIVSHCLPSTRISFPALLFSFSFLFPNRIWRGNQVHSRRFILLEMSIFNNAHLLKINLKSEQTPPKVLREGVT